VKYLLNSNTCVRILNNTNWNVVSRFKSEKPDDMVLCSIVKAELLFGAERSSRRAQNLHVLATFSSQFASLPFDDTCAEHYGRVHAHLTAAGTPIGPNDLMIAAIALAHNLTLVTHNSGEFGRVPGLLIEDWEI
jgi:tRNA(fMet)-specific endonuclease VapC